MSIWYEIEEEIDIDISEDEEIMDNDKFTGWNNFPDVKPTYDFDVVVEFESGGVWIGSWTGDKWDFSSPYICGETVKRWMAFPD